MIASLLRAIAVAIAVAAFIDPPLTMTARGRPRLAVVLQNAGLDAARDTHQRLVDALRSDFDVVRGSDTSAAAAVIVGTGYPDPPPPEGQRVFTVTVPPTDRDSNVRIGALRTPRDVAPGTLVHLSVEVEGVHVSGSASTLLVRAGTEQVEVGRATHTWTASPELWRAELDAIPLGEPPWQLRVEVSGSGGERDMTDNVADAMVTVSDPLRVVVYEPRLSWVGAFVRRALERDSRFDVGAVAFPSRGVKVSTAVINLDTVARDGTRALVVGGLDRVTTGEAGLLSRFMRERGGVVVLLPDSRADAQSIARLLPVPAAAEVLLEQPARLSVAAPLAPIQASELLTFGPSPGMRALASNGANLPVIAALPVGAGQLVVSGALDAWRYRANDRGAFDRFWQSAIAGLASAARPAIDVAVVPAVLAPGERAGIRVRVRRAAIDVPPGNDLRVTATLPEKNSVRLWPDIEPDTFRGDFTAPEAPGAYRVAVTAADRPAESASFVVAEGVRAATSAGLPLSLLAESRGGRNVAAGDIQALTQTLRQEVATPAVRVERRPMRSLWWFAPFVACLGGDWYLRRRRGLC